MMAKVSNYYRMPLFGGGDVDYHSKANIENIFPEKFIQTCLFVKSDIIGIKI